jgi:hypothetical protein
MTWKFYYQCHLYTTLKWNFHAISLLDNKFDAKHYTIKTERAEDLCSEVYIYSHNILKLMVEIPTTVYVLETQIDNNFWKPLADLFLFDFPEKNYKSLIHLWYFHG